MAKYALQHKLEQGRTTYFAKSEVTTFASLSTTTSDKFRFHLYVERGHDSREKVDAEAPVADTGAGARDAASGFAEHVA